MTKATSKRARPSPPDRDGDGSPGGSLPGNKTVPEAKGPAPETAPAVEGADGAGVYFASLTAPAEGAEAAGPTIRDTGILASEIAELARAENTAQEIMETYPDLTESDIEAAIQWSVLEAQKADGETEPAEAETPPETAPQETETPPETAPEAAEAAGETAPAETETSAETAPAETDLFGGSEEQAEVEEALAETETPPETAATDPSQLHLGEGDFGGGDSPDDDDPHEPCDLCTVEHPVGVLDDGRCPACVDKESPSATFTPEEIAAGKTPVVEQEGETVTPPEEAAPPVSAEDLATVESDDPRGPAVAVKVADLRRLVDNRWLYKTKEGYSPSYSAPWISHEDVAVWVKAGLAEDRPTAGREGGVYVTAKAARVVSGRGAA